jgi:hypothetical protein
VFQQENNKCKLLNFGQKAHRGESDLPKQLSSLFSQHLFGFFFIQFLSELSNHASGQNFSFFPHIVALFVAHFVLTYFCQTDFFLKTFAGFSL